MAEIHAIKRTFSNPQLIGKIVTLLAPLNKYASKSRKKKKPKAKRYRIARATGVHLEYYLIPV